MTDVLALADDALVTAERLAWWCSRAHDLEEDIALTNIALDQLGAARLLLTYAGELEGAGRDEDALAYLRGPDEFRNCLLAEQPDEDFAWTVTRLLFLSAYQWLRYTELAAGPDPRLAEIAARAVKESAYHLDHARMWTTRLGDGTPESRRRMQAAVAGLWPFTPELVENRAAWLEIVDGALTDATLERPADPADPPTGGRAGRHTPHLSVLLAEMQSLHRAHPGVTW
jgi:ring-1,2-phenylacetyl-CoA epoxidase subunit PaaC